MKMITKKAAMFGLDARIALIIFSVASLLVGTTALGLYKEIQYDKIFSDAHTIAQGLQMSMKDVRVSIYNTVDPVASLDNKELFMFKNLLSNSNVRAEYLSKWNGPYVRTSYMNDIEPTLGVPFRLAKLSSSLSITCNDSKSNPCFIFLKFKDVNVEKCDYITELSTRKKLTPVKRKNGTGVCDLFINLTVDY